MRFRFKIFLFFLLLIGVSQLLWSGYQFSNNYQYLIGGRAAGLGGAYAALADDASSLWYNPAGLAALTSRSISISGNTYNYFDTTVPGFNELPGLAGERQSLDMHASDFSVVANTLVYGNNSGNKSGVAFGLFVPFQDLLVREVDKKALPSTAGLISTTSDSSVDGAFYVAMFGYGKEISDGLRFGTALGLGYFTSEYKFSRMNYQLASGIGFEKTSSDSVNVDSTKVTVSASLGFQNNLGKGHKFALMIQSPTWIMWGENISQSVHYETSELTNSQTYNTTNDYWIEETKEDNFFDAVFPAQIRFGYAYQDLGSFSLAVDIIPVFPIDDYKGDFKNFVVNFSAGTEVYIGKETVFRLGFFTDFSQREDLTENDSNGQQKLDYYGVTLSLAFASGFNVLENNKKYRRLVWTSIGFTMRYGIGKIRTTNFDTDFKPFSIIRDMTVYNFQAFIAESIAF